MQSGPSLQVVLLRAFVVVHLLAAEDETLLLGWDAFLLLDTLLDLRHLIVGLDVELDLFAGECADSVENKSVLYCRAVEPPGCKGTADGGGVVGLT